MHAICIYTSGNNMYCIYLSGNIRDAVILAMVGALKNLTLPNSSYDREEEKLIIDTETRRKVELHCVPVPLSFTVSNTSKAMIMVRSKYSRFGGYI